MERKNVSSMKDEQLVATIFLVNGIIAGVISNYLNIFLSVIFAIVIYVTTATIVFKRISRNKKLINESYIIFILIWILVWITLNSL